MQPILRFAIHIKVMILAVLFALARAIFEPVARYAERHFVLYANHKGSEGTVKVGTNTLAEITGFEVSETAEVMEDTELGDAAKTFQAGNTQWTGSVECWWDETDTNGQMAMTIGSSATYSLYPEGATTGDVYYTGVGIITGVTRQNRINSIVSASYQVQGSGALTKTTV